MSLALPAPPKPSPARGEGKEGPLPREGGGDDRCVRILALNSTMRARTESGFVLSFGNFEAEMLHKLGRFLQFIGLFIVLPLAIVGQALEHLTLGQMFLWTGVGIVIFYVGWHLQQSAK